MQGQKAKILVVGVVLAAIAVIVPNTNSFVILLTTRALAFSILVMSLDILLGFTGLASLGQAAYLGAGAPTGGTRLPVATMESIWAVGQRSELISRTT